MSKSVSFIVAAAAFAVAPWAAGLGGTILGIGVGTIARQLAMTVAFSALSRALAKTPDRARATSGIKTSSTLTGETNPETIILGWTATAGQAICPQMSHGEQNRYLTHVIELCSAPGATLDRLIINDAYVTLGATEGEYGRPVVGGDYDGLIWVRYYDGSQTTADPMLIDKYGDHPDRPWTSDMVGAGICYAILTFKYDQSRLSSVPRYRFEMTGIPMYDPRRDSTAGGSGAQRWSDPSTWTQSVNNAVIAYNVMRGITLPGGDIWGGRVESVDVPLAVWVAGMNVCDLGIDDGDGGTFPQYRCGIEAYLSDEPADVLDEILKGCSGDVADIAGTWKIRVGGPSLPVMTITDRDVIRSKEESLDPFPALDSTYNGISATFPDPAALWESKEAPARYNAEWESADRFGRKVADIQLNATPYLNQAQRLMRGWIESERRFRGHGLTLPPAAAALEPLDTISWSSERNGYANKWFEITETVDDLMTCCQGEALKEVDPTDYDWSPTFALPSTPSAPGYTLPAPEVLTGWDLVADSIKDAGDVARRPALRMIWNGDLIATGVQWEIRVLGSTAVRTGSTQAVSAGGYQLSDGILPETTYQARGKPIIPGRDTAWTDWASATTGENALTMAELSADFRAWLGEMHDWIESGAGAEAIEALTRLGAISSAGTAETILRMAVESGPSGVLARIGLRAMAGDSSDDTRVAALFLEALAGGQSRVVIQADRFAIANGDGLDFPFIVESGVIRMRDVQIDGQLVVNGTIAAQEHEFSWPYVDNSDANFVVAGAAYTDVVTLDPMECAAGHDVMVVFSCNMNTPRAAGTGIPSAWTYGFFEFSRRSLVGGVWGPWYGIRYSDTGPVFQGNDAYPSMSPFSHQTIDTHDATETRQYRIRVQSTGPLPLRLCRCSFSAYQLKR